MHTCASTLHAIFHFIFNRVIAVIGGLIMPDVPVSLVEKKKQPQQQPTSLFCGVCNRYFSSVFSRKRHAKTHAAAAATVVPPQEEELVTLRIYKSTVDGSWKSEIEKS